MSYPAGTPIREPNTEDCGTKTICEIAFGKLPTDPTDAKRIKNIVNLLAYPPQYAPDLEVCTFSSKTTNANGVEFKIGTCNSAMGADPSTVYMTENNNWQYQFSTMENQELIKSLSDTFKILNSELAIDTNFSGAGKLNCEKSGGSFIDNNCVCSIEEEIGQTQELMYDKKTGYCQSTQGGPAGDAYFAQAGLPYGEYAFYNGIIQNLCLNSGGEISGSACICSAKTTYNKSTGYCE